MKEIMLPYYEERQTAIDMLVFHCSAYPAEKLADTLRQYKCSCHYIIEQNGEIYKVVDEKYSAFHAGKGFWRGRNESLNQRSIGIELCHPTLGQTTYKAEQIAALIELAQEIVGKYGIKPVNVVGHSDVAPTRKADPGCAFPWQKLATKGLGLWYDMNNAAAETNQSELLAQIGYDTAGDIGLAAARYAFCRHFMPQAVVIDDDVMHLVDNVVPEDWNFYQTEEFLRVLQAAAQAYK